MNKIATFWERVRHEIASFWLPLFLSFMIQDGQGLLTEIYNRNFSAEVLFALKVLVVGTLVKILFIKLWPNAFPLYKTNTGIIPANEKYDETQKESV